MKGLGLAMEATGFLAVTTRTRNRPRREQRGFYFVRPWSHTPSLRGPGLQARIKVLGRRGACLYPGNCCRDPTIWAARVRATHHPQTRGSRSLCARRSFESQGQRRPFHSRGLLRRSCLHAARLVAPQRQVHGHLQDTTRPEAACLQPCLHLSSRICDQKGLLHAHPADTVTLETLEVPPQRPRDKTSPQ